MRSFVYLSSAKLEPLYAHIKEPIRKRVALALGISVPALPVAPHFEAQVRSPTENEIGMLAVVLSHLHEAGDIGTVDEPRPYFAGQLTLNWGSADEFVFLSGSTPRTLVALTGSNRHVIGYIRSYVVGLLSVHVSTRRQRWLMSTRLLLGSGLREFPIPSRVRYRARELPVGPPGATASRPFTRAPAPLLGVVQDTTETGNQ
jgi:hypothetical protein